MSAARRLRRHWALAAVCAVFLLAGAHALEDYGFPWDLVAQLPIGQAALDYLAGDAERAFDQLPGPHDEYYGALVEAPLILAERLFDPGDGRDIFAGRYFLTHLLFLAGGVFCYLLVLRLFDNRLLALVAMALFLLHPRLYAHSFFNSKDIPFLTAFVIALYLIHRAFRRGTLGAFLLCGVGVGLLVNLRVMGIILFAAVLALRALDLLATGSGEARRRALLTGGAFALAAILAYYASLPVLWTDPPGRFVELLRAFSAHENPVFHLFRGEWLYSRDGPPFDYVPVWVAITTPPATLLLAAAGAVALVRGALRRPRDILRDGPTRFGLLLAALPAVTAVAVVLLENNLYDGWRQLYFLYAPLLLLAVYGLHGITESARGRWPRAGAYALAGAAIAVALVSMVRIHPHLHRSFTLLADRTTPGRLESGYVVQPWGTASARNLFADIAADHPFGPLFISSEFGPSLLFPGDGERFVFTNDFRSGQRNFRLLHGQEPCPARVANTYVSRYYRSIYRCVVDPVAYFDRYRREALATTPLDRSHFDAYRVGNLLVYVRDDCSPDDLNRQFFLRVQSADGRYPPSVTPRGTLYESRDFNFRRRGARIDGDCVAIAPLPEYPIARIHTGQFTPAWAGEARRAVADAEPLASSAFDVWLTFGVDGPALTYVREDCAEEDTRARFLLHVYPADGGDLPDWRVAYGFANLDFDWSGYGARTEDGACVAVAPLPAWPIASINTGQFAAWGGGDSRRSATSWAARFAVTPPTIDVAALTGEPLARAVFSVWRDGNALVYVRDGCTEEDAESAFFLHVHPVDAADLPAARREHGFGNLDFFLWERGARTDGRCVAVVPLPAYAIARVETGQYDEAGRLWTAEFALP